MRRFDTCVRLAVLAALVLPALAPPTAAGAAKPRPGHHATAGFLQAGRPVGFDAIYDTPNFRVHFDDDPSSVNYATTAYIEDLGGVFEHVFAEEVGVQGWMRPASDGTRGGDGRIDVYVEDFADDDGIYGFAARDADAICDPARCTGLHGWMGMDNDYVGYFPDPPGALRATTAHEFHHLIQFTEAAGNDGWFFESTATWEESVVYPEADARTFYIDGVTTTTNDSIEKTDGTREYGYYVFLRQLAQRYGASIIRDAWRLSLDHGQDALAGLDAALQAAGSSFSEAFAEFAAASAAWNHNGFPRDDLGSGPVTYPEVTRLRDLADGGADTIFLDHGSFAQFTLPAGDRIGAHVTVDPAAQGAVAIVADFGPGAVATKIVPIAAGEATVSLDELTGAALTLVVVNGDLAADTVGFAVEVGSDIVGEDPDPEPSEPPAPQTELVDGARVGRDDPIEQAIRTSQALFGDGDADRVVLATVERFPDALAGSALAGADGPILYTGFNEQLDPRVFAEIERVTGGSGTVLTLGGTAAVTEAAADEARTAGGDVACAAPFPVSCRYAGTGREETAALIAETVLTEHGGTIALIARGDVFADAITAGGYGARLGVPILLTPPNQADDATAAFLGAHPELTDVVVLGGVAAVDEATASALGATDRVAGAERTATSVAVATQLWAAAGQGNGGAILVNVRADPGWQAALAAAVASAVFDAPQLGVENPPAGLGPEVASFLGDVLDGPIQAFGSSALVSDAQLQEAVTARG